MLPTMQQNATKTGFVDAGTDRTVTFGDHLARVCRAADGIHRLLDVSPADRIAVLSLNSVAFLELWHASLLGAAVMNPLNLRFSPDELAFVLSDSETEVCFVDPTFAGVIDAVRERTSLRQVVLLGEGDHPCDLRYDELVAAGEERLPVEPEEDQPAVLIYTGGTTGRPKGVVLDQRAEVLNQYHLAMRIPWHSEAPFLIQTPMFHGASMLGIAGAPMFGVSSVVLPAFEPGAALAAFETYEIGSTVMVPTMIAMLLGHESFTPDRLKSVRRIIYGASPMPSALLERLLTALPDAEICQGYGMTEAATILTILEDREQRAMTRPGSAGRALPGVTLAVRGPDDEDLAAGEVGEICARGGNFMVEYLNRPDETAAAIHDGWYHSGDVGYLDEDGYVYLVDRAKDMIISGGENVYSVEVENAIASHPAVAQVAVIGIPHELWGEAVHAVVVLRPGEEASEDDLIAFARTTIGGYKLPRSVAFRTEPLPMSGAMKVLKRELRAPYWEGLERAVN